MSYSYGNEEGTQGCEEGTCKAQGSKEARTCKAQGSKAKGSRLSTKIPVVTISMIHGGDADHHAGFFCFLYQRRLGRLSMIVTGKDFHFSVDAVVSRNDRELPGANPIDSLGDRLPRHGSNR